MSDRWRRSRLRALRETPDLGRRALLGMAAAPLFANQALAQRAKTKGPVLCVLSTALTGVGYAEIGEIVKQLGFDGVDFTMMPGGSVEPSLAPVDEVRAFESVHGAGLEAPVATTALLSPRDPWSRTLLALAGRTGVGLLRCGLTSGNASFNTRADLGGLAYFGREYGTSILVEASSNSPNYSLSDARTVLAGVDPKWTGISLNSDCFADAGLEQAMPLVKAVVVSDFVPKKTGREWTPLGKGSVEFGKFFGVLARAGFTGPITVEREYKTADEPGALAKDAAFIREQIRAAARPAR